MRKRSDPFPTRLQKSAEPIPRIEPVVHARNQYRWEGPLDEVSLSLYERDGFLWFEGFFSKERMLPFFEEMKVLAADEKLRASEQVISDPNTGELRSVFGMHELSQEFSRLTRDPRILGIVRQLLGSEVYIHQSRINDKIGFESAGFDWHSDFETWHAEDGMPAMRAVSVSLMLADRGGIEAPKGPAGSILFFECNTLHASNTNLSPWPRSNLFFVYNSVENKLEEPYAAPQRRPGYLAARHDYTPLEMHDEFPELANQGVGRLRSSGFAQDAASSVAAASSRTSRAQ